MRLAVTAFCLFAFSAVGADRTLNLRNASSIQSQQELATLMRATLEITSAKVDTDRRTLTISGTDSQISAAEWLLAEIDRPAATPINKPRASSVYHTDGMAGDDIRIFFTQGGRSAQELSEAAVVIRSAVEIRHLFTYTQVGGIVVRGTPEQLDAAEWVWRTLETDPPVVGTEELRTKLPGGEPVMHAYRMPMEWSPQELNEASTMMRSLLDLRRLFIYPRTRTIIARADELTISAMNWLAVETMRPASPNLAESEPFRMQDPHQEGLLRVFRLPATQFDAAKFQSVAVEIRKQTQVRRAFTFNTPRMIALRGTEAQIEQARKIIAAAK